MICPNCRSEQFEEDEQGNMCCAKCAVQSQEYIAQSFDAEEGMVISTQNGRLRTKHVPGSNKTQSEVDHIDVDQREMVLTFLQSFQFALKLFLNQLNNHYLFSEREKQALNLNLKNLWMSYLSFLRSQNVNLFQWLVVRPETSKGLLRPSKPMILGFIYLSCRIERLTILPCDIVRLCQAGIITYSQLYDQLPTKFVDVLSADFSKIFRNDLTSNSQNFIVSPSSIFLYASHIAELLEVEMPPFNGPMVASSLIKQCGLPSEVWSKVITLTHIWSGFKPIENCCLDEEHYPERIAAIVLIACRLCSNWLHWRFFRSEGIQSREKDISATPIVNKIVQLDEIPRSHLNNVLGQFRSSLIARHSFYSSTFYIRHSSTEYQQHPNPLPLDLSFSRVNRAALNTINQGIYHCLNTISLVSNDEPTSILSNLDRNINTNRDRIIDDRVHNNMNDRQSSHDQFPSAISSLHYDPHSPVYSPRMKYTLLGKRKYSGRYYYDSVYFPNLSPSNVESRHGMCYFLSYHRYASDTFGKYHSMYYLLLNRMCEILCLSSSDVLERLVLEIEKELSCFDLNLVAPSHHQKCVESMSFPYSVPSSFRPIQFFSTFPDVRHKLQKVIPSSYQDHLPDLAFIAKYPGRKYKKEPHDMWDDESISRKQQMIARHNIHRFSSHWWLSLVHNMALERNQKSKSPKPILAPFVDKLYAISNSEDRSSPPSNDIDPSNSMRCFDSTDNGKQIKTTLQYVDLYDSGNDSEIDFSSSMDPFQQNGNWTNRINYVVSSMNPNVSTIATTSTLSTNDESLSSSSAMEWTPFPLSLDEIPSILKAWSDPHWHEDAENSSQSELDEEGNVDEDIKMEPNQSILSQQLMNRLSDGEEEYLDHLYDDDMYQPSKHGSVSDNNDLNRFNDEDDNDVDEDISSFQRLQPNPVVSTTLDPSLRNKEAPSHHRLHYLIRSIKKA